jgi:hypothetical protein
MYANLDLMGYSNSPCIVPVWFDRY